MKRTYTVLVTAALIIGIAFSSPSWAGEHDGARPQERPVNFDRPANNGVQHHAGSARINLSGDFSGAASSHQSSATDLRAKNDALSGHSNLFNPAVPNPQVLLAGLFGSKGSGSVTVEQDTVLNYNGVTAGGVYKSGNVESTLYENATQINLGGNVRGGGAPSPGGSALNLNVPSFSLGNISSLPKLLGFGPNSSFDVGGSSSFYLSYGGETGGGSNGIYKAGYVEGGISFDLQQFPLFNPTPTPCCKG